MNGEEIHIATKDTVGDYDAIESAKPGEPLFPIQGGDPLGPDTVLFWAESARALARSILNGDAVNFKPTKKVPEYQPTAAETERAEKLFTKATAAEMVAWSFRDYQRGGMDAIPGERHSYNEAEALEPDALDIPNTGLSKHEERRTLITMVGVLHNSLATANDVAEGLDKLGLHPEAQDAINRATALLREAAELIEPRRGMERT